MMHRHRHVLISCYVYDFYGFRSGSDRRHNCRSSRQSRFASAEIKPHVIIITEPIYKLWTWSNFEQ